MGNVKRLVQFSLYGYKKHLWNQESEILVLVFTTKQSEIGHSVQEPDYKHGTGRGGGGHTCSSLKMSTKIVKRLKV